MFSNWKLDYQHVLLALAFLVGTVWAVANALHGQALTASVLLPIGILVVNNVLSFLKSPPSDPGKALQQGESTVAASSAVAKVDARGYANVRSLALLSIVAGIALCVPQITACSWWSQNQAPVVSDLGKDSMCVLGAILGGSANPAAVAAECAPLTVEQALSIAKSLFDFYALGQLDAGFVGAPKAPFTTVPVTLSASDLDKLRAFLADAGSK